LKHILQEEGVHKHALEQESGKSSKPIEGIDGVPKGASSSFDSPPHEGNEGEREMYKSDFDHISFDHVKHGKFPHKHWKRIACSFCGLVNHSLSRKTPANCSWRPDKPAKFGGPPKFGAPPKFLPT